MSHLDVGIMHALLDGEIPSTELPPIQAHLESCVECRALLEDERRLLTDADGLIEVLGVPVAEPAMAQPPALAQQPRRARWTRGLAWAATLVAAVGLGYAARGWRRAIPQALPVPAAAPRVDTVIVAQNAPADRQPEQIAAGTETTHAKTSRRRAPIVFPKEEAKTSSGARDVVAAAPPTPRVDSTAARARETELLPAPAAPAAGATSSSAPARAPGNFAQRADERKLSGALRMGALADLAPPQTITFPDAVGRLHGSLRLIEGMVPLRLEAQGETVRVVYAVAQGELVLSQRLVDNRIEVTLLAPPGFPTDSLARLRSKVRE